MSESETDADSEPETGDVDAEMSVEELKRKYESLPDVSADEEVPTEVEDETNLE
jgi:hypothetical protein